MFVLIKSISQSLFPREIERVVREGLSEDKMISVNSIEMHEAIKEFERSVRLGQTAQVDTEYNTMDQKVRLVPTPLLEDN